MMPGAWADGACGCVGWPLQARNRQAKDKAKRSKYEKERDSVYFDMIMDWCQHYDSKEAAEEAARKARDVEVAK
jgi:hypothetical protein